MIEPCPFCGETDRETMWRQQYSTVFFWVECRQCQARGPVISGHRLHFEQTKSEAHEAWKKRG